MGSVFLDLSADPGAGAGERRVGSALSMARFRIGATAILFWICCLAVTCGIILRLLLCHSGIHGIFMPSLLICVCANNLQTHGLFGEADTRFYVASVRGGSR